MVNVESFVHQISVKTKNLEVDCKSWGGHEVSVPMHKLAAFFGSSLMAGGSIKTSALKMAEMGPASGPREDLEQNGTSPC